MSTQIIPVTDKQRTRISGVEQGVAFAQRVFAEVVGTIADGTDMDQTLIRSAKLVDGGLEVTLAETSFGG